MLPADWDPNEAVSMESLTPAEAKEVFEKLDQKSLDMIKADADMVRSKLAQGFKPRNPFEALLVEYVLSQPTKPGTGKVEPFTKKIELDPLGVAERMYAAAGQGKSFDPSQPPFQLIKDLMADPDNREKVQAWLRENSDKFEFAPQGTKGKSFQPQDEVGAAVHEFMTRDVTTKMEALGKRLDEKLDEYVPGLSAEMDELYAKARESQAEFKAELAAGKVEPMTTTGPGPVLKDPSQHPMAHLLSSGKVTSPGEQTLGPTKRLIEAFDKYSRKSPLLYRAIHGRRFLLPHHRQNDYPSQDILNQNFSEQLHCMALGMFGYADDVHNAQAGAMFTALHHGRPVLFMERELGQKLLRTKMLSDLKTQDIMWRFPGLRIILPYGLLTIERRGQPQSAQYLDIAKIPAEGVGMPAQFVREVEANIDKSPYAVDPDRKPLSKLKVCMGQGFLVAVTSIDYSEYGFGPTLYAYTAPWEDHTLGKLVSYEGNMNTALECDKTDEAFLERVKLLTVNTLTFLSSIKFTYVSKVVRRLKYEGKHLKPELASAMFVGQQQIRREASPQYVPGPTTGIHLAAHMRWGHWRRKAGLGKDPAAWGERNNLIWIEPYMTHGYDPTSEQAE